MCTNRLVSSAVAVHLVIRARQPPRALAAALIGVALLLAAIAPASANATGSYPGETLSLTETSPAVVGVAVNFQASGAQTDVESYAGGFSLEVFYKPTSVDPSCAPSFVGENNAWGGDLANEFHPVVGLWQEMGMSFSVPFKIVFEKPGTMLICAYSEWVTDTAAAAQLTVAVTAASGSNSTPGSNPAANPSPTATPNTTSNSGPAVRPANMGKPHVTRSGRKLTCHPGTWADSPTGYSYGWLLSGHRLSGDRSATLGVIHKLRGHSVQCSVTASNAAGHTTAVSSPFRVH